MEHTFVVEGKTFNVDIQKKETIGETKYVFIISKVRKNEGGNTESTNIPINLFSISSEGNIPEYWNSESECLNWAHNLVDRNHKRL